MGHLSRWYVLLGIIAFAGAALLLGATTGELMRRTDGGAQVLFRYEAPIIGLAVIGVFLFMTATGLQASRASALGLALLEALALVIAGVVLLTSGAAVSTALQAPQVFVVLGVPLALASILVGARLLRSVWHEFPGRPPFSRADARALALLAGVIVAGVAAHLAASGLQQRL